MGLHPKVATAGFAGAATVVLVWILHQFVGLDLPPEVASATTTLVSGVVGWITPAGA